MSNPFKAIDTYYNGIKFRSRLEARFAVFFDACGLNWEYEKEGYELIDTKENKLHYLPDFIIHNVSINGSDKQGKFYDLYVEVKGDVFTQKDTFKHFVFTGCAPDESPDENGIFPRALLVVGPCFPKKWKSLNSSFYNDSRYYSFENINNKQCPVELFWNNGTLFLYETPNNLKEYEEILQHVGLTLMDTPNLDIPIQQALSARFEFGETPDIKNEGE